MLLNNLQVTELKKKFKKYLESKEKENTTIKNLCDLIAKTVLRVKFIAIQF